MVNGWTNNNTELPLSKAFASPAAPMEPLIGQQEAEECAIPTVNVWNEPENERRAKSRFKR